MKTFEIAKAFYHRNEVKLHVGFFVLGFFFDFLTTGEVDETWVVLQQVVYLTLILLILTFEHLQSTGVFSVRPKWVRWWEYRGLLLHFMLGTVLNLYSLFFLKSASAFNSIAFVILLLFVVIANELPQVQKRGVDLKWGLFVLCLFCFFTILFPLLLGFVGVIPFLMSASMTVLALYFHFRILTSYQRDFKEMSRSFLRPGLIVVGAFIGLYFSGLIPPVPLAAKNMGVFHGLEKQNGKYFLSHSKPWWKVWQSGDSEFYFRPGDPVYFFARIFSPARFSDEVVIHWLYHDPRSGWMTSDRVKMNISGGRKEGFRGYSVKKNYQPGDWRVQLETNDGREIGRIYFRLIADSTEEERTWEIDEF